MTDDDRTVIPPRCAYPKCALDKGHDGRHWADPLQPPHPDPRRSVSGGGERTETWWRDDCGCKYDCALTVSTTGPRLCDHCQRHEQEAAAPQPQTDTLEAVGQLLAHYDIDDADWERLRSFIR